MKKLLVSLLVGFCVCSTQAASFLSESFLRGQNLVLKVPAADVIFTNLYTTTSSAQLIWTNSSGQLISDGTNSLGASFPYFSQEVPVYSTSQGLAQSNTISVTLVGSTTQNTNTFTFEFARAVNNTPDSSAADTNTVFSFAVTGNSTNSLTIITNVPLQITTAVRKLKLNRIIVGTNQLATTVTVSDLSFNGFAP